MLAFVGINSLEVYLFYGLIDLNDELNSQDQKQSVPEPISCDGEITRSDFIKKVLLYGALGSAPVVVDKFLVPPVYARHSIRKRTPPTMVPDAS